MLATLTGTAALVLLAAPAAQAHPLGNFTVNTASSLVVRSDGVRVELVVDAAEIPTLQAFPQLRQGAVSAADQSAYRATRCAALRQQVHVAVGGRAAALAVTSTALSFPLGAAGLHTSRLTCQLSTSGQVPTLGRQVDYRSAVFADRVGWHEVVAAGDGVRLTSSTVPSTSVSDLLRHYPADLLSSPLAQETARFTVAAGADVPTATSGPAAPGSDLPLGAGRLAGVFTGLVATEHLTFGFGVFAVALALLLGGLHAFAPGHGKTVMAAYLVGRNGTLRQALVIGCSVTVTHTVGVLALGILLSATVVAAPERVYPWLGLVSGLLLTAVGVSLLRRGPQAFGHEHSHEPGHEHGHSHQPGHTHPHDEGPHDGHHTHGADADALASVPAASSSAGVLAAAPALGGEAALAHAALHHHAGQPATNRRSLLAVGFIGGLVPSPSALVVLLGGIALGRAWFGVLLVVAYGAGMAMALVGTGLALVRLRGRMERRLAAGSATPGRMGTGLRRAAAWLPRATAVAVILLGVGLALRGAAGI